MAKNGLVWIATGTASGAASLSIDNCFSASYTHYLIKQNYAANTTAQEVDTRLRVSAADDTGANYRRQYLQANSTVVDGARATGSTSWVTTPYVDITKSWYQEIWVSNPFEAVRTTAWSDASYDATSSPRLWSMVFAHDLTTSYTGLTFFTAGGGTITGTISVWGLVTA